MHFFAVAGLDVETVDSKVPQVLPDIGRQTGPD
jgi:hypothetical protein